MNDRQTNKEVILQDKHIEIHSSIKFYVIEQKHYRETFTWSLHKVLSKHEFPLSKF